MLPFTPVLTVPVLFLRDWIPIPMISMQQGLVPRAIDGDPGNGTLHLLFHAVDMHKVA